MIYMGFDPLISRSFTVPQTESLPILPPGNSIGVTTKLSVVIASLEFPGTTAESSSLFNISLLKYLAKTFFISPEVDSPPLPCAIVTFISRLFHIVM